MAEISSMDRIPAHVLAFKISLACTTKQTICRQKEHALMSEYLRPVRTVFVGVSRFERLANLLRVT